MRKDRVTLKQAEEAYKAAKVTYKGVLTLPEIDFTEIFAGRKSMTWSEVLAEIGNVIDAENS